jgi:Na+-transporting methylmalonyl-CoA/oxaloacetate decarboxylase beta subunit
MHTAILILTALSLLGSAAGCLFAFLALGNSYRTNQILQAISDATQKRKA